MRSASSDSSAMVCNSGTGTSGPMTAAICTRRLASGGGVQARRQHCFDGVRQRQGAGAVAVPTAAQVNSSTKKGLPAALATIACCSDAGSCTACGTDCSTTRLSWGDSRGSAIWVAAECRSQGG